MEGIGYEQHALPYCRNVQATTDARLLMSHVFAIGENRHMNFPPALRAICPIERYTMFQKTSPF